MLPGLSGGPLAASPLPVAICQWQLLGHALRPQKTSSWGPGLRALDGGEPRRASKVALACARGRQPLVTATVITGDDSDHTGNVCGTDPGRRCAKHFSGVVSVTHRVNSVPTAQMGELRPQGVEPPLLGPREAAGGGRADPEGKPGKYLRMDVRNHPGL